ncbi:hypothetical protein V6N13_058586 [Hibiscus sabdariffa]|uniref:Uncharacterized protein n=1 Tax=Hibiscus sabdariffa TaxID=183260 RepID=A0ABR2GFM9_9ROSI
MSIPNYKSQDSKQGILINVNTINTDPDHLHDSFLHRGHEDDEEKEEEELIRFVLERKPLSLSTPATAAACWNGKVIGKTFSVRADLEDEKQSSSSSAGIEKAVRRVFSSASANHVYRRLHHPVADEENTSIEVHTQKGNKILGTCRRFFGF